MNILKTWNSPVTQQVSQHVDYSTEKEVHRPVHANSAEELQNCTISTHSHEFISLHEVTAGMMFKCTMATNYRMFRRIKVVRGWILFCLN